MRRSNPFAPTADLVSAIEAAVAASPARVSKFGLRVEDGRSFRPGEYLPDSRRWDDGDPTEDTEDGVCVHYINPNAKNMGAEITAALDGLRGYFGDNLVLVGGRVACDGVDPGESIIRDGECLASFP